MEEENIYQMMEIEKNRELFLDAKVLGMKREETYKQALESIEKDKEFSIIEKLIITYKYGSEIGREKVAITIAAFPPDRRRRDLDNILKCLFDSLQHAGVFEDDSQIKQINAEMMLPQKPGYVLVQLCKHTTETKLL